MKLLRNRSKLCHVMFRTATGSYYYLRVHHVAFSTSHVARLTCLRTKRLVIICDSSGFLMLGAPSPLTSTR
ncbi:hypothetical protein BDZ89DRAFT_1076933, partial [Hymenopellis radicata]